jgi:hypothetical protein
MTGDGAYTLNPCPAHCPDRAEAHAHLRDDDGDFIVWADGRFSGYDLTQPARLIYPTAGRPAFRGGERSYGPCYRAGGGFTVHVRPGCRCPR